MGAFVYADDVVIAPTKYAFYKLNLIRRKASLLGFFVIIIIPPT